MVFFFSPPIGKIKVFLERISYGRTTFELDTASRVDVAGSQLGEDCVLIV